MTPEQFQQITNVSRETLRRLRIYADLLGQWQSRVNLVGPRTIPDMWNRHFFDSAQLYALLPDGPVRMVDIGSGGGFPGLVLSIMGVADTHLIESDQRKAVFLREVVRATGAAAEVHACRAEAVTGLTGDVVMARALAPLERLIPLVQRFVARGSVVLLPKGQHIDEELTRCAIPANIRLERIPSQSDPRGSILRLTGWA
ncbi:MAG: 16S rRNA (guanine(527)-N(7))-methyltransferase RsmG [Pseudomonadota bacterium]